MEAQSRNQREQLLKIVKRYSSKIRSANAASFQKLCHLCQVLAKALYLFIPILKLEAIQSYFESMNVASFILHHLFRELLEKFKELVEYFRWLNQSIAFTLQLDTGYFLIDDAFAALNEIFSFPNIDFFKHFLEQIFDLNLRNHFSDLFVI